MDMSAYKEKKAKKSVSVIKVAKDFYQVVAQKYDPDTGKESTPEIAQTNPKAVEDTIAQVDAQIAQLQDRKAGLLELKADMEALG
jgi:hypothetical protein